jgi:uncharacterized RDD family membrane protein YckC
MSDVPQTQPPGWYYAQGDPPGTQRYWDGSQWQGAPQPVPGSPQGNFGGPNLAEPINRIGARIIDGIIWIIVSIIPAAIFGAALIGSGATKVSYISSLLAGIVSTALVAGYEIFMVGTRGATLGKMALGLKVIRADGAPATMQDAAMRMALYIGLGIGAALLGRSLGRILGFVQLIVFVVSFVFLFTDKMRQTLWDKVGKTIVVSTK